MTACALPVEWLDFHAKAQGHDNQLFWQTAHEFNHSHYVTEKSMDGISFIAFGQVNSSGNDYSFTDDKPWKNTYYRIKQVDFDGQFSYSNVVLVEREQTELLYSFDQEAQILTVDLPENHNINLDLIDIQGKKMMDFESLTHGKNQFFLNISPGIYFLQWIEQGKQIKLERIMIMK